MQQPDCYAKFTINSYPRKYRGQPHCGVLQRFEQIVMKVDESENKVMGSISGGRTAVVGKTLQFDGNIKGDEDLLIEGIVEGTIILNNAAVTVAKNGLVRGDIMARTILVQGEVRGEMRGNESVEIAPSGVVHGDIRAPRVMLQDGCQFKGLVDMDHKESPAGERKRPPQPVSPAKKKAGLKAPKGPQPLKKVLINPGA